MRYLYIDEIFSRGDIRYWESQNFDVIFVVSIELVDWSQSLHSFLYGQRLMQVILHKSIIIVHSLYSERDIMYRNFEGISFKYALQYDYIKKAHTMSYNPSVSLMQYFTLLFHLLIKFLKIYIAFHWGAIESMKINQSTV